MKKFRMAAIILVIAMIAAMLTGCGSSNEYAFDSEYKNASSEAVWDDGGYEYTEEAEEDYVSDGYAAAGDGSYDLDVTVLSDEVERKLTYTANVEMETKTYRETIEQLDALIEKVNGYVQSSDIADYGDDEEHTYERNASFNIQVPADSLESFLEGLKEIGNVMNVSKNVEDITTSYYNTQSRLDSLKEEEQRLLDLQAKAENLEDMLTIESYLSNTRAEINYLYNMMQMYKQMVSYSTVTIYLSEVVDYTPPVVQNKTLGEKIVEASEDSFEAFGEFAEGFLLTLIVCLPFLILIAVIVVVIVLLCKRSRKKRLARMAKLAQNQPASLPVQNAQPIQPIQPVQQNPEEPTENRR